MSEEKSKLAIEEVKFLPNGADDATKGGDVEKGAKRAVNNGAFVGLTKEELQQFADDPYWVSFESVVLSAPWCFRRCPSMDERTDAVTDF